MLSVIEAVPLGAVESMCPVLGSAIALEGNGLKSEESSESEAGTSKDGRSSVSSVLAVLGANIVSEKTLAPSS